MAGRILTIHPQDELTSGRSQDQWTKAGTWYNPVMEKGVPQLRIDRSAFAISTLQEPTDEIIYWQTKTPLERLEALELMRQILYAYDPATSRLQRVLAIAERT